MYLHQLISIIFPKMQILCLVNGAAVAMSKREHYIKLDQLKMSIAALSDG